MSDRSQQSSDSGSRDPPNPGQSSPEAPWTARDEWTDASIPEAHDRSAQEDRADAKKQLGCTVLLAIPFSVGGTYFWLEGQPVPALILGGMFLFAAFLTYQALAVRERGPIAFAMSDLPARLGERLEGVVRIKNWGEEPAPSHFDVYLSRYERTQRGHGRDKRFHKNLEWRTTTEVEGDLRRARDEMQIPVGFDLPADQPPATIPKTANRMVWALEVEAPVLDEPLMFELPVLDAEAGTTTDNDPERSATATAVEETDDEPTDAGQEAERPARAEEEPDPADGSVPTPRIPTDGERSIGDLTLRVDRSAREVPQVQMIGSPNVKRSLLALGLGLPLLGVGVLMAIGGFLISPMGLVGILFALVGGLLTYKTWSPLLCRTTLKLGNDELQVVRRPPTPVPGSSTTTLSRSDVIDVRVTAPRTSASSSPESIQYGIRLLYRIDSTGSYDRLASHIRRKDVDSDRQPPLSLPDETEGSPCLLKLAGPMSDQENAETVAAVLRQVLI